MSDLILPDHAPLESWLDVEPESGARQMVVSLAAPALHPLHDTRSMPDVLLGIAKSVGGPVAAALPWDSYDAMLKAHYGAMRKDFPAAQAGQSEDEFWSKGQAQGGWWGVPGAGERGAAAASNRPAPSGTDPSFDGSADAFNFYFQPYPSQSFRDGSLAHLPWLQEMPDVLTSAMWSSWVEINPKTAEGLKIEQGDTVEITSQHGSLRAPAVVSPGIAPDMVAMPIGQGHTNFTRFATGRGANPLSILAPLTEPETGSLAWAATRVKIARAGGPEDRKLILFSGGTTRFPLEPEPR